MAVRPKKIELPIMIVIEIQHQGLGEAEGLRAGSEREGPRDYREDRRRGQAPVPRGDCGDGGDEEASAVSGVIRSSMNRTAFRNLPALHELSVNGAKLTRRQEAGRLHYR